MTLGFVLLFAGLAIALGVLAALSPGTLPPLRDPGGRTIPGSLSERAVVEIGGVPQGMFIQATDQANPVLLVLHGGPGMPDWFLNVTHPAGLERDFTVAWWEQRGAGMSWSPDLDPDDLTMERLILDTIEVADYLRDRFSQDMVYLLGHSFGSFLGIQVAARAPDRFHAYVGMAQVTHQIRSEEMARERMIAAYAARGDTRMAARLEAAPVSVEDGMSDAYLRLRDAATHRLGGGTTRDMSSVFTGVFLPMWGLRAYTLREKIGIWRGKAWSRGILWEDVLTTDLTRRITRLDLPFYVFVGAHDLTVLPDLSREIFDGIEAPVKGFYVFPDSAHSPVFEDPDRARRILLEDVLRGSATLADAN
jgi:pimeloyl-ACP methyl ester carboxylesterase